MRNYATRVSYTDEDKIVSVTIIIRGICPAMSQQRQFNTICMAKYVCMHTRNSAALFSNCIIYVVSEVSCLVSFQNFVLEHFLSFFLFRIISIRAFIRSFFVNNFNVFFHLR